MANDTIKRNALAGAISILVACTALGPVQAEANSALRNEMHKMFTTMSNTTSPGAFETARRGVISGGSFMTRNKIMNTNIVNFQPPSFNGGCGGIDMFGGSFSFINKEQFVQLARTIASNAASYAFYVALDSMAPTVRTVIDGIQKKIQEFNQYFGNSCQLAKGIATDPLGAFETARQVTGGLGKSIKDGADDIFGTLTGSNGSTPTENPSDDIKDTVQGNIVWQALQKKGVSDWFTYGGKTLNEAILSATGSVIVGKEEPADDGKGKAPKITPLPGGLVTLEDLIDGKDVEFYSCSGDCLDPGIQSGNLPGFKEMILETLLGSGSSTSGGIVGKLYSGTGLSSGEKNFIANLPQSMGPMIVRLTRVNEQVARTFVNTVSEPLAREMSYTVLSAFNRAARVALAAYQDNAYTGKAEEALGEARDKLDDQYQALISKGQKLSETMRFYNDILEAADKGDLSPSYTVPETN